MEHSNSEQDPSHTEYLEKVVSAYKETITRLEELLVKKDKKIHMLEKAARRSESSPNKHKELIASHQHRIREKELLEINRSLEESLLEKEKENRKRQQTINELLKKIKETKLSEKEKESSNALKLRTEAQFKNALKSNVELAARCELLEKEVRDSQLQLMETQTLYNELLEKCQNFEQKSRKLHSANLVLNKNIQDLLHSGY